MTRAARKSWARSPPDLVESLELLVARRRQVFGGVNRWVLDHELRFDDGRPHLTVLSAVIDEDFSTEPGTAASAGDADASLLPPAEAPALASNP